MSRMRSRSAEPIAVQGTKCSLSLTASGVSIVSLVVLQRTNIAIHCHLLLILFIAHTLLARLPMISLGYPSRRSLYHVAVVLHYRILSYTAALFARP